MRVLFVGGSNTVRESGYTRDFVRCLSDGLGVAVEADNIAVGGSPCTFGLQRLLARTDFDYDLFVVEYMANDILLASGKLGFRTWRAAYEGIVRLLKERQPSAPVLSVLLGRRSSHGEPALARMAAEIERLSEHYGGVTADVHAYLEDLAPDGEARSRMFRDDAHYAEPFVTALVGHLAAAKILPHLLRPAATTDLPAPRAPVTFEHAKVIPMTGLDPDPGPVRTFENSRYRVDAVRLSPADGPRDLLLPGPLISLGFVSTPDAGRLVIEETGWKTVATDTLSLDVSAGDHPFLLKSVSFPGRVWDPADATPRMARVRALGPDDPAPDGAELVPSFDLIPPASASDPAVYLTDALCFGTA